MRFHIILNRHGGTLRTLDVTAFASEACEILESAGHDVSFDIVDGADIVAALEDAVSGNADVIMVGGGDGTISAAAGKLMDSEKALAVLPAGTMNLFARSLGVPLSLEDAVVAFANGTVRRVDLGSANDRVFVHQFSIGLHAKLIRIREKATFRSRLGKIWASMRAGMATLIKPPRLRVRLEIDELDISTATVGVGVSNNLFGEGHLPYADMPDQGKLGVYVTRARRRRDLIGFAFRMALGQWRTNTTVKIYEGKIVKLSLPSPHRRFGCAIDGELCDLEQETLLRIHPAALKVLIP